VNILADESVDAPVITRLRQDGHVVEEVGDLYQGMHDVDVLALAVRQHQLLLTADRDFGDMIVRDLSKAPAEGVVLYRLKHIPIGQKVRIVADALAQHAAQLSGAFTVIQQTRVRHRPIP
jgi:predicted nuclease of predicted toxin-antitoxin system